MLHLKDWFSLGLVFGLMSRLMAIEPSPNILLICIDDLRADTGYGGAKFVDTPNLDALAGEGRAFLNHYVAVPTCGASRYAMLTGQSPLESGVKTGNGAFQQRAKHPTENRAPSMPQHFRANGYHTVAIGKVSHHPGGMAGENWADPKQLDLPESWGENLMPCGPWKTPQAAMHGYAGGKARERGKSPVFETTDKGDRGYPDGWIAEAGQEKLAELSKSDRPWLLAVGLIKPHLPFTAPDEDLVWQKAHPVGPIKFAGKPKERLITWHGSGEFGAYFSPAKPNQDAAYADEVRQHYFASVRYVDRQVGKLLDALEKSGEADQTIVVVWSDHGFMLGERGIWGKHCLYEEALKSPLIIKTPGMAKPGQAADGLAGSASIFHTLCDLSGLSVPEAASKSPTLLAMLADPDADGAEVVVSSWGTAVSYRTGDYRVTRKNGSMSLEESSWDTFNLSAPTRPELTSAELKAVLNVIEQNMKSQK